MATPKAAEILPTQTSSVLRFDEDGDLQLEVGQDATKQTFFVCSRSLSRVSKPFKTMLYGGYAESKPRDQDDQWTVNLPEDNATAFIPILQIIHHKFHKVPENVSRDQLYEICILADKYDTVELLVPWASGWICPFDAQETFFPGDEILLWISWVLGHYDLFRKVMRYLITSCTESGVPPRVRFQYGKALDDNVYIKLLGLPEVISSQRKSMLEQLNTAVQSTINALLARAGDLPNCCDSKEYCQIYYLGLFMRTLLKDYAYPLRPASLTTESFHTARTHLVSLCDRTVVVKEHLSSIGGRGHEHIRCNPGPKLAKKVKAMESIWEPDHAQIRHLNQQARKCGLPIKEDAEASASLSQSSSEPSQASASLFRAPSGQVPFTFGIFSNQPSSSGAGAQSARAPSSSINAGMSQASPATTGGQLRGPAPGLFGAATW